VAEIEDLITSRISGVKRVPLPKIKAGLVGFGEVNSPRDLIERKLARAREALEGLGLELVTTTPVSDDPAGHDEARARDDLAQQDFDL